MKAVRLTSKHELHALGQCEEMASERVLHVCGWGAAHSRAGMGAGAPWACTEWRGAPRDKHIRQQVPAQGGRAEVGSVSGGAVPLAA